MFEAIVLVLVVMLMLLATLDLFVGVSNDAANFLNSAVGTRIAPLFVIMLVASVGVLCGATFSSGMMEVARKGMLFPELFSFEEIMLIFAAVMISDVLLLNLFNSFGLPTSTTVSIVFELLGAATFASFYKVYGTDLPLSDIFNFIKLDRTATIVSAILLSVVLAFITGMVVQFVCRLLFTFRFDRTIGYLGGVFCGFSLTSISYFLVIKGAKGASFMKPEYLDFIDTHFNTIMWGLFIGFSLLGQIIVLLKGNVFKLIILAGTFALAFSFAGNDLVNFVGVPLAALDSYEFWSANALGDKSFLMSHLNENNVTSTFWLFLAGSVMCLTLWVSKKARQVVQRILVPQKDLGLLVHGSHTAAAAVILDRLIETADILQNAGGEVRGVLAHFLSHVAADPGDNKRNNNADTQIGGQSQKPKSCMECADIDTHDRRGHKRDADRRDRMRVEHLKKLHVGSDQGDKVSLVLSLEFGRAEFSERAEHFVPHEREQSKGNIVIETLLREPEDRP